jgi:hypothetical protein
MRSRKPSMLIVHQAPLATEFLFGLLPGGHRYEYMFNRLTQSIRLRYSLNDLS